MLVHEYRDYDLLVKCYLKKLAMGKGDKSQWITLGFCSDDDDDDDEALQLL
jgi:hypothetical protein